MPQRPREVGHLSISHGEDGGVASRSGYLGRFIADPMGEVPAGPRIATYSRLFEETPDKFLGELPSPRKRSIRILASTRNDQLDSKSVPALSFVLCSAGPSKPNMNRNDCLAAVMFLRSRRGASRLWRVRHS